jgi:cardiolipin synthase
VAASGVQRLDDIQPDRLASRRFLTAPNAFTLLRLCCLPVFLYLLFGRDNRAGAAWLLGGLGATDWVDGWLARRFHQVSEFGKIFDPTVDRVLFVVALTAILIDGAGPMWFAWAVLVREALFGGAVALLTVVAHMPPFAVTYLGKWATFLLMFAVPGFMIGHSDMAGHRGFEIASWIIGIPGLLLSYYTALAYIPTIRHNLASRRDDDLTGRMA